LEEYARAITAGAVGIHAATVGEVPETFECLLDHPVGRGFSQLSHEANPAGIVLFPPV